MDEGLTAAGFPRDKDPFWDPVEPLLLGTAHLWLHSLAYRIPLEEQLEVLTDITHVLKGCNILAAAGGKRIFCGCR